VGGELRNIGSDRRSLKAAKENAMKKKKPEKEEKPYPK